jgi:septal ring factor EnvC (AmiA/AmiB activator)
MFENLEVKDPREACKRFKELLDKERIRHAEKLNKIEKEHAKKEREQEMALSRRDVRIEELKNELGHASGSLGEAITKERYEKEREASKAAIKKWEKIFKENEDKWRGDRARAVSTSIPVCSCQLLIDYRRRPSAVARLTKANTVWLRRSILTPTTRSYGPPQ